MMAGASEWLETGRAPRGADASAFSFRSSSSFVAMKVFQSMKSVYDRIVPNRGASTWSHDENVRYHAAFRAASVRYFYFSHSRKRACVYGQ